MLDILGSQKRLCDGLTRRQLLTVGGLGLMGPGLADIATLQAAQDDTTSSRHPHFGRAKSVILLFLYGGVSQIETFDPKPDAPIEVRGKLGSIPTSIPGCRLGEGLSKMARMIDRATVIRSMTHPYPIHGTAYSVTSTPTLVGAMQDNPKDPRHWPFIGSVVDYLDRKRAAAAGDRAADAVAQAAVPRNIGLPFLHSSRRRNPILNAGPYG